MLYYLNNTRETLAKTLIDKKELEYFLITILKKMYIYTGSMDSCVTFVHKLK